MPYASPDEAARAARTVSRAPPQCGQVARSSPRGASYEREIVLTSMLKLEPVQTNYAELAEAVAAAGGAAGQSTQLWLGTLSMR